MTKWLEDAGVWYSYRNKKLPCAPTTRFPDFAFVAEEGHVVVLEVDENAHKDYNERCEVARIQELMDVRDVRSLHILRYNPHAFENLEEDVRKYDIIKVLQEALASNACVNRKSKTATVIDYIGYTDDRITQLEDLFITMQKEAEDFNY